MRHDAALTTIASMDFATDNPRTHHNLLQLGTVADVDHGRGVCRVACGDILTDWAPWFVPRAGQTIEWSAPTAGEQVLLLCPDGDMGSALVLRGLYSDSFPQPANGEAEHLTVYPDGARIRYDHQSHALTALLPSGGTAEITADGGVTVNGPLTVNGDSTFNGDTQTNGDAGVSQTLTAQTDCIGGGKSLKGHRHIGVTSGGAVSGPPQ